MIDELRIEFRIGNKSLCFSCAVQIVVENLLADEEDIKAIVVENNPEGQVGSPKCDYCSKYL